MRRVDNLATFMCRLSRNLGASTSWNPQSLSRPVTGLLYFTNFNWISHVLTSLLCFITLLSSYVFRRLCWLIFSDPRARIGLHMYGNSHSYCIVADVITFPLFSASTPVHPTTSMHFTFTIQTQYEQHSGNKTYHIHVNKRQHRGH
jgi:hypothetical protein